MKKIIPLSDVSARYRNLKTGCDRSFVNSKLIYSEAANDIFDFPSIVKAVSNWTSLDENQTVAAIKAIELFDFVCEKGTLQQIDRIFYLVEDILPKVRDAKAMQTHIKKKLASVKTKITTKINNKIDNANSAAHEVLPNNLVRQEKYENMVEAVNNVLYCDRILRNHADLSKKFNFDMYIMENSYVVDTDILVIELCKFIDTYNLEPKDKYGVALENILYGFHKNGIKLDSKIILEAVTDYFLMSHYVGENSDLVLAGMKSVLKNIKFYHEVDTDDAIFRLNKRDGMKQFNAFFDSDDDIIAFDANDIDSIMAIGEAGKEDFLIMNFGDLKNKAIALIDKVRRGFDNGYAERDTYANIQNVVDDFPEIDKKIKKDGYVVLSKNDDEMLNVLNIYKDAAFWQNNMGAALLLITNENNPSVSFPVFTVKENFSPSSKTVLVFIPVKKPSKKNTIFFYCLYQVESPNGKINDRIMRVTDSISYKRRLNEASVLNNILEESKVSKVQGIINTFKMSKTKSVDVLRSTVNRFYTCNAEEIVSETPNILNWFFNFFIVISALAINPVLAIFAGFTNYCIGMHLSRKQTAKIIDEYKKNREKAQRRLDKASTPEQKERISKYIKQIDSDIKKLEEYNNDLLSDEEKYANDDLNENCLGFSKNAIAIAENLYMLEKAIDLVKWNVNEFNESLDEIINKAIAPDIAAITEFAIANPDFIDKFCLENSLKNEYKMLKKDKSSNKKYARISWIKECIEKLEESCETDIKQYDKPYNDLYDLIITTESINSAIGDFQEQHVLEMNYTNTINLMIERIKKGAQNLSDQEKIASRTVDSNLEMLKDNMEKAMTQENREAVIKGNILPPASKIIKLAIMTSAAWVVSPALSVISLLGAFAISSKIRNKERQLIYEEIDVELQMVDKYIKIAEEKNDMKNLRELLKIQRKLQAQEARLKYKMKIEWNKDVPDTTKKD